MGILCYMVYYVPVVDRIQSQSNKFVTGVENKETADSKLNYIPVPGVSPSPLFPEQIIIGI